jgi:hypothetical protein
MKWVTWENVGVDRIGCAWLIRTHIDPQAEFAFTPEGSKTSPPGAEPFDIPGARFSHHGGRCSLHTILREHKLDDPTLLRIARIIDEADTVQEMSLEPTAPGLDLICRGLRLINSDDHVALGRGGMVYDALYAELRREEDQPAE